jgi:hypothetical protein
VSIEVPDPRSSLSAMAKAPSPPVLLPRAPASSNRQPPCVVRLVTVQPSGVSSNASLTSGEPNLISYPAAVQAPSTGTLTSTVLSPPSSVTCVGTDV